MFLVRLIIHSGAAGVLISANRIVTKALLDNEKANTIIFFVISIGIIFFCFIIHFVIRRTEFVRYYMNMYNADHETDDKRRITLEPTEDLGLVSMDKNKKRKKNIIHWT